MIVTFVAMAIIYLLLNAQFIAVAQVMVYAGAIMMLILFVMGVAIITLSSSRFRKNLG
jgi:NADH-quinone oxidoreductase subunit J